MSVCMGGRWVGACMHVYVHTCVCVLCTKSIQQHRVVKPHPNACIHSKRNKTPRGQPLEGLMVTVTA